MRFIIFGFANVVLQRCRFNKMASIGFQWTWTLRRLICAHFMKDETKFPQPYTSNWLGIIAGLLLGYASNEKTLEVLWERFVANYHRLFCICMMLSIDLNQLAKIHLGVHELRASWVGSSESRVISRELKIVSIRTGTNWSPPTHDIFQQEWTTRQASMIRPLVWNDTVRWVSRRVKY